jgi:hypothetical protein
MTIAANDHVLGAKVLNRETKRVKFNGTMVISSETTNRNQILDKVGNYQNIGKKEFMSGSGKCGMANMRYGKSRAIAYGDTGRRRW